MAAFQGFITIFQLAALVIALATTLGLAPPDLGRSASSPMPGPAPAVTEGDTTALL